MKDKESVVAMGAANQVTESKTERASKKFWAIDDYYNAVYVTGWACPDYDDPVWWVPELGYSLTEKHHLFSTQVEAEQKAIAKVESNIADLQSALSRLRKGEKPLPHYLDCAMCGASAAFVIDNHDPAVGYCFAEKQAWKVSANRTATD